MSKVILEGYIDIPAADLPAVLGALPEHKALTLSEPGCLVFSVEPDADRPDRYHVYEEFVDQAAFELHQARTRQSLWGAVSVNVSRHYQVRGEAVG